MYDRHQISDRLAVVAGLTLLAALIVPTAFAVEPMIEGGNERGVDPPPAIGAASASGFDWSTALLLVVVALVVFGSVLALHHAASRRGSRLATR